MSFIVTIDGPAGTGKGTVTKLLSQRLGFMNLDTGAIYRCVALEMINKNINLDEEDKIKEILTSINIDIKDDEKNQLVLLNGEDVTKKIREHDVSNIVSPVSSLPIVRYFANDMQRKIADGKKIIVEGRDCGTEVFPNADVKIYLDASEEVRVQRRIKQDAKRGISSTYEEILDNIRKRDENDKNKKMGALKKADDATYIDGTNLNIKQVENTIYKLIKQKQKSIKKMEKIYTPRPETTWKKIERKTIKGFLHFLYIIVYRVRKVGEENIPDGEGVIVCANHLNMLDAAAIVVCSKKKINFIAKEELMNNPFLNWLAHIFDIIPIRRGMRDMQAMKRCIKSLKNNEILGIFPEGTRRGLAKQEGIKNGACYMAMKTGSKVVPVGIQGSFKPFTRVTLNYGKPIDLVDGKKAKDLPEKEMLNDATKTLMDQIIMLTNEEI